MAILPESSLLPERKTDRSIKTTCQFSRLRWLRGLATTFTEQQDGFHAGVTRSRVWPARGTIFGFRRLC
jgi:hypothetical protein